MKKLIVCLTLAAFAMISSAQAGEKCEASACASKDKAQAKASCSASKVAKSSFCPVKAKAARVNKGAVVLANKHIS